jgi:hypothetical protein
MGKIEPDTGEDDEMTGFGTCVLLTRTPAPGTLFMRLEVSGPGPFLGSRREFPGH